ncbi:GNAT family N-acetyltransferase [Saccharothrix yanglingensis]|uniref:GNAT family N-acetyltransferase n=1 Tax=Saccharothrix yanglingensis TaxID=659496 RepID=A0ABU0WUE7_9PSEU|nr:GNAT family N-acetyltransferase [Saccharothrix yanglingensis]
MIRKAHLLPPSETTLLWRFVEDCAPVPNGSGIRLATIESDFDDVDTVWREVYGREHGWLPADAPALHKDRYHPNSAYLIAAADGHPVGTMRLVVDTPEGLPIEQFTGIDALRVGDRRLVECQRLMVMGEYRNRRAPGMPYGVFAALVKGCLHWCLRHGYSHIVADLFLNTSTTPMAPLLALGFTETGIEFVDSELDEPDRSVALLLELGELFSRPFRSTNPFYRYLIEPDTNIAVYS